MYLIHQDGELYQCAAHGNKNPLDFNIENPIKLKIGEGIWGYVAQSGMGEVIADTSKDSRYEVLLNVSDTGQVLTFKKNRIPEWILSRP
ncbi:MAG: hypothetical protein ACI865_000449 [Flavobacteriaceae bacterium]